MTLLCIKRQNLEFRKSRIQSSERAKARASRAKAKDSLPDLMVNFFDLAQISAFALSEI